MAIESSNRSPSPMSIRQNPNPNPHFSNSRNHGEKRGDICVRRSASGSPFSKPSVVAHPIPWSFSSKTTSANSPAPAENARRSSFSKETATLGLSRDMNEHKENKKPNPDPNSKALRGSKNFMSPTISAVSKVTPSPRKKALAERNEAVRTSASLSDGKFLFFAGAGDDDLKGETENCEFQKEIHKKEETPYVSTCEAKKKVTFDDDVVVLSPELLAGSDSDEPFESLFVADMIKPIEFSEMEQKEPCLDISKAIAFVPSPPSPIALLDADPSVPSYDPNTNFLSPRPQFLRYNPRRKIALSFDTDQPKNHEDTLGSETGSDNDVGSTVEEVQSEEVPVQEEESLGSSVSSSSVVEEVKFDSSDDYSDEEEISVESEETSGVSEIALKPRFFTIWRAITWLALFGVVALLSSMIASNDPDNVLSKVYQMNNPIHEFAKSDFSGSLQSMRKWSDTYLPLMISSFREADMVTPSQFHNFSEMVCDANDHFVEHRAMGFPLHSEVESHPEANLEEVEVQSSPQFEEAELPKPGVESQPMIDEVASEQLVIEEVASEQPVNDDSSFQQTQLIERMESGNEVVLEALEKRSSYDTVVESGQEAEAVMWESLTVEGSAGNQYEVVLEALEERNSYNTVVESGEEEAVMSESITVEGSAGNQHQVLGAQGGAVAFLVASLCVATAFSVAMIAKYKKANNSSRSTTTKQAEAVIRKEELNPSNGSQLEAEDIDAETYNQSEMSSYSLYDKPVARGSESEAHSKERKQSRRNYKRESLASSSSEYTMGSTSYGSFTTYSIRPTRNGDEEYVTPVRRSSRIRKQVVSP